MSKKCVCGNPNCENKLPRVPNAAWAISPDQLPMLELINPEVLYFVPGAGYSV
jgi:hypothetical protein